MEIDKENIDNAALVLLQLTLHDENRAWKGIDIEVTKRLHDKGHILNPAGKRKSVVVTDQGLDRSGPGQIRGIVVRTIFKEIADTK